MYVCMYVCVCICVYIYIYIYDLYKQKDHVLSKRAPKRSKPAG